MYDRKHVDWGGGGVEYGCFLIQGCYGRVLSFQSNRISMDSIRRWGGGTRIRSSIDLHGC